MKIQLPGRSLLRGLALGAAVAAGAAQAQTSALPDSYGRSSAYAHSYRGYTSRDNPYAPGGIYDPYRGSTLAHSSGHATGPAAGSAAGTVSGDEGAVGGALGGGRLKGMPSINDQAIAGGCASSMLNGLGAAGGGTGGMSGAGAGLGSSLSGNRAGMAGTRTASTGLGHRSSRLSHRCSYAAIGSTADAGSRLGAGASKSGSLGRRQPQP